MQSLSLLAIGAFFALLFLLNNLIRTIRRSPRITFWEMVLAFLVAFPVILALIEDNRDNATFDLAEGVSFGIVAILIGSSAMLMILELFRPQRLRQSRGILGMGISLVLTFSTVTTLLFSIGFALTEQPVRLPTPINQVAGATDPCDFENRFGDIFLVLFQLLSEETGLSIPEVFDGVGSGDYTNIAAFISDNGGDPEAFMTRITVLISAELDGIAEDGCITQVQANLAKPVIESQLRPFIFDDIDPAALEAFSADDGGDTQAGGPFGGIVLDPLAIEATLTATVLVPTASNTPTATDTPTPTISPTPTASRTPRASLTPSPTRDRYLSPTPSLTPTLPNPCLAVTNFNINFRTYPDLEDSEVITTIPFETTVAVFGRNEDSSWWFAEYEGEAGWLSGEFISLTNSCYDLPARDP